MGRLPARLRPWRRRRVGHLRRQGSWPRILQPGARGADARRMSGPNTDRTEKRKIVRRGERTIDVRLITYPAGKRKR